VKGPIILNDRQLAVSGALKGIGIAMWAEHRLLPYIDSGQLVPLLTDWSPRFPGFFAYYRMQRFMPAAMRAFIDALKSHLQLDSKCSRLKRG
jgi:DNA-binding transcriptional LysR family regulator